MIVQLRSPSIHSYERVEKCRGCHVMEGIRPERKRGQRQHADAIETGTTCIACHYNLVHKEVEPSEAFLEAAGGG